MHPSDRLYLFRFSPRRIERALAFALFFGFGLYVFLPAWATYDWDERGLRRKTLSGSGSWTWAEIGGMRGREIRLRANEASKSRP